MVWYIWGSQHFTNQGAWSFLFTFHPNSRRNFDFRFLHLPWAFKPHIGKYIYIHQYMDPMGWKPPKKHFLWGQPKKHDMFCWVTWPIDLFSNKPSKHVFKLVHLIETFNLMICPLFWTFGSILVCEVGWSFVKFHTRQRWISWPISSQRCHDWRIIM